MIRENHSPSHIAKSISTLKLLIIDNWVRKVRLNITPAESENNSIIVDHLEVILEDLHDFLISGKSKREELGKAHGYQRAVLTDFSLDDLLLEYELLRSSVIEYLYPFVDLRGALAVHQYLDQLCSNAVREYVLQDRPRSN